MTTATITTNHLATKTLDQLQKMAAATGLASARWNGATDAKYRKFLIGNIMIAATKPEQVQMVLSR